MVQGNNKIIYIVVISTIFGLASGIIGSFIARVYFLEKAFNVPLIGGYSYIDQENGGNLVIQGARKIVVEQNAKVEETISSAGQVITGIFEKKGTSTDSDAISSYYQKNNEIGQGFIITSDGWMFSKFTPAELKTKNRQEKTPKHILEKYVVITGNSEIYEIDEIIYDSHSGYSFWRMNGSGFPVRKLVSESDLRNGQLLVAVNWDGLSWLTNIVGVKRENGPVYFSDMSEARILLAKNPTPEFTDSFVFDLNGGLAGIVDGEGEIKTTESYLSCINCLLKNEKLQYPSFGAYYLNMGKLVDPGEKKANKGALVYKNKEGISVVKGGPADKAGLKEGDLILSVDNMELNSNNDLGRIISRYTPGETVSVNYERNGEIKYVNVILGEVEL